MSRLGMAVFAARSCLITVIDFPVEDSAGPIEER
jgi:hypothetical protein